MERIVLEVNDELARAWRNAPVQFRERVEKDLENQILEKIRQAEQENLFRFLDEVREEALHNGLTHDKLETLLNGDQ
jgi:FKBP-type peptidyl-prolyl cis-trans isomerase (trigger factor)